jgi:PBP1b-binding outer membrane lipoprotein LpoB
MNKTALGLLASTLVFSSGCSGDNKPIVSTSKAGKSQKASEQKPIDKKEIKDEDVKQIPNQFPLKDGKLPKGETQKKKADDKD